MVDDDTRPLVDAASLWRMRVRGLAPPAPERCTPELRELVTAWRAAQDQISAIDREIARLAAQRPEKT